MWSQLFHPGSKPRIQCCCFCLFYYSEHSPYYILEWIEPPVDLGTAPHPPNRLRTIWCSNKLKARILPGIFSFHHAASVLLLYSPTSRQQLAFYTFPNIVRSFWYSLRLSLSLIFWYAEEGKNKKMIFSLTSFRVTDPLEMSRKSALTFKTNKWPLF